MLIRGGATHSALAAEGNPILLVDPGSARAADQIALPRRPLVAAGDGRTLWVGGADGMLTRISGAVSSTVETPNVGGSMGGLAIGNGSVWATDQERRKVVRFDPSAWKVVDRIPVGNGAQAITFAFGSAWVASRTDATIYRVDPSRRRSDSAHPRRRQPLAALTLRGRVALGRRRSARHGHADRSADETAGCAADPLSVRCRCRWPTATAPCGSGTRRTGSGGSTRSPTAPPTTAIGSGIDSLAVVGETVWAEAPRRARGARRRLRRPRRAAAAARRRAGRARAPGLPAGRGGDGRAGDAPRWDSARRRHRQRADARPHDVVVGGRLELLAATNDGLVGVRRVGGAAGSVIVPDLARSLPVVDPAGTTYTFFLRQGLRYSTGRPVRASDVRASIERLWRMPGSFLPGTSDIRLGLRGEGRCVARPRRCDLRRGIAADDAPASSRSGSPAGTRRSCDS